MKPKLIVMLTHNDVTVPNAIELFEEVKDLPVDFWGFKDVGLPAEKMKELVKRMKDAGKTTFLEVVRYSEEEGLESARLAIECDFDYLMGTVFHKSILELIRRSDSGIKYFPFCGKVYDHPSILDGTIDEVVADAKRIEAEGADGFDLLAYRYTGDPVALIKQVIANVKVPVISAGSINSFQRVQETIDVGAWAFTIGGAFFEKKFVPQGTYRENIMAVQNMLS